MVMFWTRISQKEDLQGQIAGEKLKLTLRLSSFNLVGQNSWLATELIRHLISGGPEHLVKFIVSVPPPRMLRPKTSIFRVLQKMFRQNDPIRRALGQLVSSANGILCPYESLPCNISTPNLPIEIQLFAPAKMPNQIRDDIYRIDEVSFDYIFEQNATIQLKDNRGTVRCNVYRPKSTSEKYPVLVTYGPYGKDIHYSELVFPCPRIPVQKTHQY